MTEEEYLDYIDEQPLALKIALLFDLMFNPDTYGEDEDE